MSRAIVIAALAALSGPGLVGSASAACPVSDVCLLEYTSWESGDASASLHQILRVVRGGEGWNVGIYVIQYNAQDPNSTSGYNLVWTEGSVLTVAFVAGVSQSEDHSSAGDRQDTQARVGTNASGDVQAYETQVPGGGCRRGVYGSFFFIGGDCGSTPTVPMVPDLPHL